MTLKLGRVLCAVSIALTGCGSGGSGNDPATGFSGTSGAFDPQISAAQGEAACSWPVVSNPDLINLAFPDEGATYWVGGIPYIPGTRLRIEGQFPQARYFSFNVYDPQLRPVDAITDYQLLPRVPGTNPYRNANAPAGDYVAYVIPQPKPDEPATNTIYSGSMSLPLGQTLPLNPMIMVIYRIYLPEVDGSGGVPLPKLTLETADGSAAPLALSLCQPLPPDGIPSLLNDLIRESNFPLQGLQPSSGSVQPPGINRFYSLPETARVLLSAQLGVEIPATPLTEGGGGGFLSNVDNAYVTALFTRQKGSLYVVRAKAPTIAVEPTEAPLGSAQLRYWSICTNEVASQRFVACLYDEQWPLDADGYFTLVVSDPGERPANAEPANHMEWLPWGGLYPDSLVIYRHMLPSPHFTQAIQNIPYGTPVEDVMQEFTPQVTYCDKATVEAAGNNAAAVFTACQAAFTLQ